MWSYGAPPNDFFVLSFIWSSQLLMLVFRRRPTNTYTLLKLASGARFITTIYDYLLLFSNPPALMSQCPDQVTMSSSVCGVPHWVDRWPAHTTTTTIIKTLYDLLGHSSLRADLTVQPPQTHTRQTFSSSQTSDRLLHSHDQIRWRSVRAQVELLWLYTQVTIKTNQNIRLMV